jgi:hypothetical protein
MLPVFAVSKLLTLALKNVTFALGDKSCDKEITPLDTLM